MATAVYEVPADAAPGPVRRMTAEEVAALDARVHCLQEVLVVASLLANVPKFPLDMLNEVLLLADFMVTYEASTQELHRGRSNMNDVYLALQLPLAYELALPEGVAMDPQCVELDVECASHDQGWASQDNEHDGTYNSSYTWSEIAIVKSEDSAGRAESEEVPARQVVTKNVRVESQFRRHFKQFKDPHGLVQQIALGDTVQLVLRSQYPGWANTANFGRLRVRFRIDICEDAQLMNLQELAQVRSQSLAAGWTSAAGKCCLQ